MKKAFFILALFTTATSAFAQWTTVGTNDIRNTNTGNVGIGTGTTAPSEKLTVNGNALIKGYGYYYNVESKIIPATDQTQSYNGFILKSRGLGGVAEYQWSIYTAAVGGGYGITPNGFDLWEYPDNGSSNPARQRLAIFPSEKNGVSSNISPFTIGPDGKVAIGYLNPNSILDSRYNKYVLAVNGSIGAKKITVNQTDWPDYVFDSSYKLPSLYMLENYVTINKHLPDVITASEVEKEGIDLGENQAILLKKIEELTLYIIQQQKEIDELKTQLQELKK